MNENDIAARRSRDRLMLAGQALAVLPALTAIIVTTDRDRLVSDISDLAVRIADAVLARLEEEPRS